MKTTWKHFSHELFAQRIRGALAPAHKQGRPSDVKARLKEGVMVASSVIFAVVGEADFRRLCKSGLNQVIEPVKKD